MAEVQHDWTYREKKSLRKFVSATPGETADKGYTSITIVTESVEPGGKSEVTTYTGRRATKRNSLHNSEVRRLPFVRGCGHKLAPPEPPRHSNCKQCWASYFMNQKEFLKTLTEMHIELGSAAIEQQWGIKFLRSFLWFVKLLSEFEKAKADFAEQEKENEINRLQGRGTSEVIRSE